MRELDDEIKKAFDDGGGAGLVEWDDPSLMEMVRDSFRGQMRVWMFLTMFMSVVLFGVSVWTIFGFMAAETTRGMIGWALGFYFCTQAVGMIKMYHWMTMYRNSILREIKRVEYRVAKLAERAP